MRRALLVVHTNTYFTGLLDVGRMLKKSGRYEPVFFFTRTYLTISKDLAILRAENISYINPICEPMATLPGGPPAGGDRPTRRGLAKRWLGYLPEPVAQRVKLWGCGVLNLLSGNVFYHLRRLAKLLRSVTRLIRQQKPSFLVLGGDLVHYDTAVFIIVAHQEHIPAVVIPGWMASAREAAEAVMHNPAYSLQQRFNRLVGALYPRWVYEHKGRRLLRLPAAQVLAREWLGLAPPLPWILHSGYADAIAVESEAMRLYCVSEGLPSDQLVLTGSMAHDVMAETLKDVARRRTDLCHRLNLPPGRPMLLSALPPDFLYMVGGRPECDFQTYDELVYFWVQSLAAVEGYNVVISLHPSVAYEDMKYIEQWGVKIAREATMVLIPLCDIYVASISATIQWAIACGKPVVNYDVYRYRYPDYAGVEGVITLEEKEEFLSVLKRLTQDHEFYAEVTARQAACAGRWGVLDGQAGRRMLQLFDRLVEQYHS